MFREKDFLPYSYYDHSDPNKGYCNHPNPRTKNTER
jgi:hypothetical protein